MGRFCPDDAIAPDGAKWTSTMRRDKVIGVLGLRRRNNLNRGCRWDVAAPALTMPGHPP